MEKATATIFLRSALGTPLMGDTLFGQLCWEISNQLGGQRLDELLQGYTRGEPFLVLSDALPAGYLPLPHLPLARFDPVSGVDPKQLKKRSWIAIDHLQKPVSSWLAEAAEYPEGDAATRLELQPHNSINRHTGTTGKGGFAPYTQEQMWKGSLHPLEIHLLFDEKRIALEEIEYLLGGIGLSGYGRDASIGLGKFELASLKKGEALEQSSSNAGITLAPSAPQGMGHDPHRSFYTPFTRFGRHGGQAVHLGNPFKTPLLLAERGAMLADGENADRNQSGFVGQGIGGDGQLSKVMLETVHQGYAPVVRVEMGGSQ